MTALDIAIGIQWFETIDSIAIPKEDIVKIEKWIEKNGGEICEVFSFVKEHEIEAAKIIEGKQVSEIDGKGRLMSYELYFFNNIILIVLSEETQDPEN